MSILVITGTDTGVGKTVVAAAIAALGCAQGHKVAVLKPAQTGARADDAGDLDVVSRLAGDATIRELRRYPDPLAPETAARRSGITTVTPQEVAEAVGELEQTHDLVLIEGAGGLLVRFDADGGSLADVAWSLGALVVVVARAGLGTLNHTALTAEVATRRGLNVAGVIVGSWPADPGLAEACNVEDLPVACGAPMLGVLADGMGDMAAEDFLAAARRGLSPWFGGTVDPERFVAELAAQEGKAHPA